MRTAVFEPKEIVTADGDIGHLAMGFLLHLRAERLSPRTQQTYCEALKQFAAFLAAKGMPQEVTYITREHVETFITDLLERWKPATAHNRYRSLQSFFGWLVDEGEIKQSPMAKMKPPKIPEQKLRYPTAEQYQLLRDSVKRDKSFEGHRDLALIVLLADTGARRAEVVGIRWNRTDKEASDVDFVHNTIRVTGKGERTRDLPLGKDCARYLDRYVRARDRHPMAYRPELFIGSRGAITDSGIQQIFRRRGRAVGLPWLHAHVFRHFFAHQWLAAGGQEEALMRLTGWRTRAMLQRYAAAGAIERALEAHKTFSPADRLA